MLFAAGASAWMCPDCGRENSGTFCEACHLPEPPEGMIFVPETQVDIDGVTVEVHRFFIDRSPVTCRDFIPWLNSEGFTIDDLGVVITGSGGDAMEFLAFTPFIGDQSGGITVPSQCLENPVTSITWNGAQSFLADKGKRLPTLAELTAAAEAGLIEQYDSYEIMLSFADQMRFTMGEMLGVLGSQAMFAGYSTANERVTWELTSTVNGGDPARPAPALHEDYVNIYKPLDEAIVSTINRNNGYFNVIFRGAIRVP